MNGDPPVGPITLVMQIQCVRREIDMREHVYPGLVRRGRMNETTESYEMRAMNAVLQTLLKLKEETDEHK